MQAILAVQHAYDSVGQIAEQKHQEYAGEHFADLDLAMHRDHCRRKIAASVVDVADKHRRGAHVIVGG